MIGAWATVATTLLAAAAFGIASGATWNKQAKEMSLFYGGVSIFLIVAAMRQVAGVAGALEADKALFYAVLIPAALPIIPLVAMATRLLWGQPSILAIVAWTGAIAIGISHAFWRGLEGPLVSDWGTEWAIRSGMTQVILILFVTIPGLIIGAYTWWHGRRLEQPHRARISLVGISISVYYVAFTIDALAAPGASILFTRLFTMGVALVVAWAYHRQAEQPSVGIPAN